MIKSRRTLLLLLSATYLLFLTNWIFPVVRTSSAIVNHTLLLIVFLLPISIGVIGFFAFKHIGRLTFCIPLGFISLCSVVLAILSLLFFWPGVVKHGFNQFLEPMRTIHISGSQISVYRTDYGATASFGIVVRQERTIFPGIMIVRRVYTVDPGYEVEVTDLQDGTIRIVSPPYSDKRPNRIEAIVPIKFWVYL